MGFKPLKPARDGKSSTSLDDLDARLREAQARRSGRSAGDDGATRGSGLSFALRIGVELVSALAVGVGIGVLLDRWWGTAPWMLVVFFLFGSAAGVMNVFRVMKRYDSTVGYRGGGEDADGGDGGPRTGDR